MRDILIVDDEKDICDLLSGMLQDSGYKTRTAHNSSDCFVQIQKRFPSLIILDIWLKKSNLDGIEVLLTLKKYYPQLPVIMISGHGTIDIAVKAMQRGAFDFLEKPIKFDHLLLLVKRALECNYSKDETHPLYYDLSLNGAQHFIDKCASQNSRLIIHGPKGTGKKYLAQKIHAHSERSQAPFVTLALHNISQNKVDIALFGETFHDHIRPGIIEKAHLGTLYLEGIEFIPWNIQQKLIDFMTRHTIKRHNDHSITSTIDTRIISAMHISPEQGLQDKKIMPDFFNLMNKHSYQTLPIYERYDSLEHIIFEITKNICREHGFTMPEISNKIPALISQMHFPNHYYDLKICIEQALLKIQTTDHPDFLTQDAFSFEPHINQNSPPSFINQKLLSKPLKEAREAFEKEYLSKQLDLHHGNISKTADFIGMQRSALHRKLNTLNLTKYTKKEPENV